jgi:NagD protein
MSIDMEKKEIIERIKNKKAFISDMDGVIYHGNRLLPGVPEFVDWLKRENKKFLFLTNSSERTQKELQEKMHRLGIDVEPDVFYTSALATANFLSSQKPRGTAFIIGEAGLINAMYNAGYTMNNVNPDYVVVNLVLKGAKLIGTNSDVTGPVENGIIPATRALMAPIELSTGREAYYVGKPNPLMMRIALKKLGCSREETIIIGDRMDTDIVAGIESEIDTILVLSGISTIKSADKFPYRPHYILEGVNELI